ncbi:MAG TPA: hypothetical protein VHX15_06175 [Frankiaceae bacterium]|nr:hypothetical protein [Frankiaceae bacterium]
MGVLRERAPGDGAWFDDASYVAAGAAIAAGDDVFSGSDIVLCVQPPGPERQEALKPDTTLIGWLRLRSDPALARRLADAHVTALSLDGLPHLLSSAQSMHVLSSQTNAAGYKAALVAADAKAALSALHTCLSAYVH